MASGKPSVAGVADHLWLVANHLWLVARPSVASDRPAVAGVAGHLLLHCTNPFSLSVSPDASMAREQCSECHGDYATGFRGQHQCVPSEVVNGIEPAVTQQADQMIVTSADVTND